MKMKKIVILISLILTLLLQGCGRDIFSLPVKENAQELVRFNQPHEYAYNKEHYPLQIDNINSNGELETMVFEKPPKRVVAVWQNSIETLLALGVGDRIIAGNGVPDKKYFLPEYREAYSRIPYTGLQLLDLETTMLLEPDFIVGWHSTFAPKVIRSTDFWHFKKINTYIATNSVATNRIKTLQNEYDDIVKLGKIFDKNARAQELVGNMQKEISYAVNKTANYPKRPRALVIEFLGKNVSCYGERTLAGNIVNELKGNLLGAQEHNLSIEQIVDYNPDVIFLVITEFHYGNEKAMLDRLTQHKALKNLKAVRGQRVYPLPLYAIYSSGIRTYDGIKIIARGLYPELYEGE